MKNYGWKFLRLFVGSLAILGFTSACGTTTTTTKTAKTAKTTITTMSITSAPTIYSHMPFKPDYFDDTPAKAPAKHRKSGKRPRLKARPRPNARRPPKKRLPFNQNLS